MIAYPRDLIASVCYNFQATDSSICGIDISKQLPIQISLFSKSWPFEPVNLSDTEFRFHVMRYLPSWERATALCEAYLENLSWFLRLINRDQLITELMPMVYGKRKKLDADSGNSPETHSRQCFQSGFFSTSLSYNVPAFPRPSPISLCCRRRR